MVKQIQHAFKSKLTGRTSVVLILLLCVVIVLIALRVQSSIRLRNQTNSNAIPYVVTLTAKPGPALVEFTLPGDVEAWHEANIYARTNGYIKKWYVDIGTRVKEGDLLAEIESPEIDAELRQAEADLNTAIANTKLAQVTAQRWADLVKKSFVSKQEADEKASAAVALLAAQAAADANRQRLTELVNFERVIAPFTGVITLRTTDIGALINAGSSTTATPLFHIVQDNPLRIYVNIPQSYAEKIKPELIVNLQFSQYPGRTFPAKLFKTAKAIDPKTRTLLAQFTADNSKGELFPGSYTTVQFKIPISSPLIRLPVNTLLFRAQGPQIAVVNKDNTVNLKSIVIGRDFGEEIEINSGITAGEQVILNPSDSIYNGQKIRLNPAATRLY